jgi:hypothetical protein
LVRACFINLDNKRAVFCAAKLTNSILELEDEEAAAQRAIIRHISHAIFIPSKIKTSVRVLIPVYQTAI